ncbi:seed lectin-like [Pistacia vera]|uniref:seed lectin-like n=1 Tax=Pistacia vera TaxID=55513 RepID=UPI0012631E34|nr:seed lectin-like [Pistacia vera]
MEFCKSIHSFLQSNPARNFYFGAFRVFLILLHIFSVNSISFNITCFSEHSDILCQGDANARDHVIQLTAGSQGDVNFSGRAIYKEPVHLWDNATRRVADFTSSFSFAVASGDEDLPGARLSFFLTTNGSIMLPNSSGGFLGLVTGNNDSTNSTKNHFVAVEFDNQFVGVHINSTGSEFRRLPSTTAQKRLNVLVEYNSSTKYLCVTLIDQADYTLPQESSPGHIAFIRGNLVQT